MRRQLFKVFPIRMLSDVGNNSTLTGKCSVAARTDSGTYFASVDRPVVKIRQTGRRGNPHLPPAFVQQQYRTNTIRHCAFQFTHHFVQQLPQGTAAVQPLQHESAQSFHLQGVLALGIAFEAGQGVVDVHRHFQQQIAGRKIERIDAIGIQIQSPDRRAIPV